MIVVEHLTKYYGNHLAVDDLSFEISGGHVYGFLGPNGAGKSTTMNIMTGCLSATEGTVRIGGHDIYEEPLEAKKLIGYLPEQPPLYMNESPQDYLEFVGKAKGLKGDELFAQIDKVVEQTGIENVRNKRISTLSKGYKQRVGIAQAILGNPQIIILDEPTVGLDPLQIIEIRDLIKSLSESHVVIFSSHILSEVQAICDQILVISKGKLVAFDTPENLEKKLLSGNEVLVTTDASEENISGLIEKLPKVTGSVMKKDDSGYLHISVKSDESDIYAFSKEVFRLFADNGLNLLEMNLKKANLEDIFIELTEAKDAPAEIAEESETENEKQEEEETEK